MTAYTIRPFEKTDADYETIVAIWNAYRPDDKTTVEIMKYWDTTRNPDLPYQRMLVSTDNQVVAYGMYRQNETMQKAKKYNIGVVVHPDHAHQQEARVFFHDYAYAQITHLDLVAIASDTREGCEEDIRYFLDNGFEQRMRYPVSQLDVPAFDPAPYDTLLKKMVDAGVEIITVKQLQTEQPEKWLEIMYPLDMQIISDMPSPNEYVPTPFEQYCKNYKDDPMFLPEACFLARIGDEYIGASNLWKDAFGTDKLWVGLTGVLDKYRRRGIATALKIYTINFAKQYGAKIIEADNEENNPMFQINLGLGFQPEPAYLDFEKPLREAIKEA